LAVIARAAVEAGPAGHVVVAHVYRLPHDSLGSPYFGQALRRARGHAEQAIAKLVEHERELPDCDYVIEMIGGTPADALAGLAVTRRARAIVVAKRWKGRPSTALRSVSRSLARRTSIPVIAVPADWRWTSPTDTADRRGTIRRPGRQPDASLWW
jgi:nucleotide-binding universal stress UspA family protein